MGGYGSGRWHRRQRRKGTVERWLSIDASMFRHHIMAVISDKNLSIDAGIRVERQIPFVISRERYPLLGQLDGIGIRRKQRLKTAEWFQRLVCGRRF